ncbi:histidine kinase [Streptomyces fradiae]|uniref:histidine kinase n=1 Tax=Streptomyces fradiae TaxID=1906 RepID=UPI0034098659
MDHRRATDAGALTARVQAALHRVRAFDGRRPLVWDAVLTGFFVVAALTEAGGGWRNTAADPDVPSELVTVLSLFLSVPLLWRRRHPLAVLAVMAPAALVSQWTGALLQAALIQQVAVFGVALRLPWRRLWWAVALLAPPLVVGAVRFPRDGWVQSVGAPLWLFALVVLGAVAVRTRREYTASLVERARRLEVERDQQARLAAAAERARIAREMHDIIGHNLSVITGLADGGRYAAAKSPERAAQALDGIASTSRQALTELRRLLGVLRDDDPSPPGDPGAPGDDPGDPEDPGEPADPEAPTAPVSPPMLAPQPALADLDELLEGVRAAGLPVCHTVRGEAPPLPPGRQLTVFRVVQEALTNTLKHAGPGATATVEVSYEGGGGVAVTVTDTGGGARPPVPGPRTEGRGLTGMRERAALYEGALEAGPLPPPAGGWRVHLSLPKDAVT